MAIVSRKGGRVKESMEDGAGQSTVEHRLVRAWYDRDETWSNMLQRTQAACEVLRTSLDVDLWSRRRLLHRLPGAADRARLSDELLNAVIGHFVSSLDPSTAVAVHEYREEKRHHEVLQTIEGKSRADERTALLPPPARQALQALRDREDPQFLRLLDFMEENAGDPGAGLRGVMEPPAKWLEALPGAGLIALAEYAASYGAATEAAALFVRAAEAGTRSAWCLGRAALLAAVGGDPVAANGYAERAKSTDKADPLARVIDAAVSGNQESLLAELDNSELESDSTLYGLHVNALIKLGRTSEAIDELRRRADENPAWAGLDLACAQLLYDRAIAGGSPSREAHLREAVRRAIRARDTRRRWRGNSSEPVAVACAAAAASFNHEAVIRLGCTPPVGEATIDEASDGTVKAVVAHAHFATGDFDTALRLAKELCDGLFALISAKTCLIRGPEHHEEGRRHARKAWDTAMDDQDRVEVLVTASALGLDPLPGQDLLDRIEEGMAALIRAQHARALGRTDEAVQLLRQYAGRSEPSAVALSKIYFDTGQVEAATTELRQAAERFQRPQLLVAAGAQLYRIGRPDEAKSTFHAALAQMPSDDPSRLHARQLLLLVAEQAKDWREMEAQARSILTEAGLLPDARWVLVGALFRQGRHDEAWQAATSDGGLEPQDGLTAALWAQLHCRFNPTTATAMRATDLLEQFMLEEPFANAIAMAVLTMDAADPLEDAPRRRWEAALAEFSRRYSGGPAFTVISVGDGMDNLFDYLRETLGPRQAAIEDVQRKVANGGTPYGVLSVLGGRPYAATFLEHGAGCLPIYPANRDVALREKEVAKAALGQTVVVDPTTLVIASFTGGLFQLLQREFQSLTVTDAAVADVVATTEHNARGDGLTIGWDNALGQAVVNQEDPDSLSERRRRARVSADWARNDLRRVVWRAQRALAIPVDGPTHDSDSRVWSWLSGLDYAKAHGLPFLCDDAALRQVAYAEGVPAFGCAALIEALTELGRIDPVRRASILDTWRAERCVDLPDTNSLSRFAEARGFKAQAASLTVSRPAFWQDAAAVGCYEFLVAGAAQHAPDQVPLWLYSAILGAGIGRPPAQAAHVASELLLRTTGLGRATPEVFAQLVAAARSALEALGSDLLLGEVFKWLLDRLRARVEPQPAAAMVLGLAQHLGVEDRELARRVVFGAA